MGAYAPEQGNGVPYDQQQQMYGNPNQAQGWNFGVLFYLKPM